MGRALPRVEDLVVDDPRVAEQVLLVRGDDSLLPALTSECSYRFGVLPDRYVQILGRGRVARLPHMLCHQSFLPRHERYCGVVEKRLGLALFAGLGWWPGYADDRGRAPRVREVAGEGSS